MTERDGWATTQTVAVRRLIDADPGLHAALIDAVNAMTPLDTCRWTDRRASGGRSIDHHGQPGRHP